MPDYPHAELGARIKVAREELGMSRRELATALGIHVSSLANAERGTAKLSDARLDKLRALGRNAARIPTDESAPPEDRPPMPSPEDVQAEPVQGAPSIVPSDRRHNVQALHEWMAWGFELASGAYAWQETKDGARVQVRANARGAAAGKAIRDAAPDLGQAWAAWAEQSPRVAAMLDKLTAPTAGAAVAVLYVQLIVNLTLLYREEPEPVNVPGDGAVPVGADAQLG